MSRQEEPNRTIWLATWAGKMERIMYLMGGLDRHVDRYIARYIGRYSTEYRSIFDRVQVDISVEYRPMYRPILLSVDILGDSPILDRYLTDIWPILDRYLTDASPILYIGRHSTDTRPVSVDISVDSIGRYMHWMATKCYQCVLLKAFRYLLTEVNWSCTFKLKRCWPTVDRYSVDTWPIYNR